MFLDNLSVSVLQLCDKDNLTYEGAAERCDLSSRFIGKIVRRESAASILTLEKLCTGFDKTPNELLRITTASEAIAYRTPMAVTQVKHMRGTFGPTSYPVCPNCGLTMEREYQAFCDRCGQMLDWSGFPENVEVI